MNHFLWLAFIYLVSGYITAEESEHGDHLWEYAGIFHIEHPELKHSWSFEKIDKTYAGVDGMHLVVVQTTGANEEALEAVEEDVEHLFEEDNAVEVTDDTLIGTDSLYEITFNQDSWLTQAVFEFATEGYYAIFYEHHPDEFCSEEDHCFKSSDGENIEAEFVEGEGHEEDDNSKYWGKTLGACAIIWCCVFTGVILLGGGSSKIDPEIMGERVEYINMFASGALLGTAVCLILVEASHLIGARYSETTTSGIWGTMILLGFISCAVIDLLRSCVMHIVHWRISACGALKLKGYCSPNKTVDSSVEANCAPDSLPGNAIALTGGEVELGASESEPKTVAVTKEVTKEGLLIDYEVASAVFIGDFFHNFSDGIFIGAAFQSCSSSAAYAVVASTVFHELAQEIADFIVLTTKGKLKPTQALLVNAVSGLSVIFGGVAVSVRDMNDSTVGMLLAFGAGTYLYLAASELYPVVNTFSNKKHKLLGLLLFALGAMAVGLVLLKHEHCEGEEEGQGGGHDH